MKTWRPVTQGQGKNPTCQYWGYRKCCMQFPLWLKLHFYHNHSRISTKICTMGAIGVAQADRRKHIKAHYSETCPQHRVVVERQPLLVDYTGTFPGRRNGGQSNMGWSTNCEGRPAQSLVVGSEAIRHISIWQAHLNEIN